MFMPTIKQIFFIAYAFFLVNDDNASLHLINSFFIHLKYCLNIIIFVVGLAA